MSPVIMLDGERGHPTFEKILRWFLSLFRRRPAEICGLCSEGRYDERPEARLIMEIGSATDLVVK